MDGISAYSIVVAQLLNDHGLHGAVFQGLTRLKAYLEKHPLTPALLSEKKTVFSLTPLSVAVLIKNTKWAALFAKRWPEGLVAQDYAGNTPIHLAAIMGNGKMVHVLHKVAEETRQHLYRSIQNQFKGTPDSLVMVTYPPQNDPEAIVGWIATEQGAIAPMTSKTFHEKTGKIFCRYVQTNSEKLFDYWKTMHSAPKPISADCKNLPKLYFAENRSQMGSIASRWSIKMGQHVSEGTLLTPFGGKIRALDGICEERFGEIHYDEQCNFAGLIEEGFPVTYVCDCYFNGCPASLGIFALENLRPGETLTLHSGPHISKLRSYKLYHKDKMEAFCKSEMFENLEKIGKSDDPHTLSKFFIPLEYILTTPAALVYLVSRGILDLQKLESMEKLMYKFIFANRNAVDTYLGLFRVSLKRALSVLDKQPKTMCLFFSSFEEIMKNYPVCIATDMLQYPYEILPLEHFRKTISSHGCELNDWLIAIKDLDNAEIFNQAMEKVSKNVPYAPQLFENLARLRYNDLAADRVLAWFKANLSAEKGSYAKP